MKHLAILFALALAASAETKPAEPKPMSAEQKLEVSRANSKLLAAQRNLSVATQQCTATVAFVSAREENNLAETEYKALLEKMRAMTGAPANCIADDKQNWAVPAQKPDGTPYLIPCTIDPPKEKK